MTGHSLGGSLAALMGTTFGAPVVAFEAPAERMAWERLHLPSPVSSIVPYDFDVVSFVNSRQLTT